MSKRWVRMGLLVGALALAARADAQAPPAGAFGSPGAFGPPPANPGGYGATGAFVPTGAAAFEPAPLPVPEGEPLPVPCPDDGPPMRNAFGRDPDCTPFCPGCSVWFEYLFLWSKGNHVSFPTLTTGNIGDPVPGALGQPGTQVVLGSGGTSYGVTPAFRSGLAYWLVPSSLAVEVEGFLAAPQANNFLSNVSGAPGTFVVARPFFNPNTGLEDADPRGVPGMLGGTVTQSFATRLFGNEANVRWVIDQCWPSACGRPVVSLLAGVRQIKLDDRLTLQDNVIQQPSGTGNTFNFTDKFTTYNEFYGGQIGTQVACRVDERLTGYVQGKVAYGVDYQTVEINGATRVTGPTGKLLTQDGIGLYAQRTNIGHYRRSGSQTLVPELGLKLGFDVNDHIRLTAGYTLLWMTNIVRPGDQMDRTVNIQPLNVAPGMLGTAQRPAPPSFNQTDFWIQTLNVGVQFTF